MRLGPTGHLPALGWWRPHPKEQPRCSPGPASVGRAGAHRSTGRDISGVPGRAAWHGFDLFVRLSPVAAPFDTCRRAPTSQLSSSGLSPGPISRPGASERFSGRSRGRWREWRPTRCAWRRSAQCQAFASAARWVLGPSPRMTDARLCHDRHAHNTMISRRRASIHRQQRLHRSALAAGRRPLNCHPRACPQDPFLGRAQACGFLAGLAGAGENGDPLGAHGAAPLNVRRSRLRRDGSSGQARG